MNDDHRRDNSDTADPVHSVKGLANGDAVPRTATPWQTLSAHVISLVSRKGGVGKTTSAVNLGAAYALSGHTVLVVGVDPQCGVARSLGHEPEELNGRLQDIFTHRTELTHLAHRAPLKNLYFVSPGRATLADEEQYLELMEREVDTFVAQIDRARNLYDTILIDCPPALSVATRAALLASDAFVVPVQAEELCCDSLTPLLDSVVAFGAGAAADREPAADGDRVPELAGLFLTMANPHTRMGRHAAARVTAEHGPQLLDTAIPRTVRLSEMALRGKPTVIYDRRSTGSRAYFDLADEIVARYIQNRNGVRIPSANSEPDTVVEAADAAEVVVEIPVGEASSIDTGDQQSVDAQPGNGQQNPEDRRTADSEPLASEDRTEQAGHGLERLLAELRADEVTGDATAASESASDGIDMVSLDDLLAEEEKHATDEIDWEDGSWEQGRDGRHLH